MVPKLCKSSTFAQLLSFIVFAHKFLFMAERHFRLNSEGIFKDKPMAFSCVSFLFFLFLFLLLRWAFSHFNSVSWAEKSSRGALVHISGEGLLLFPSPLSPRAAGGSTTQSPCSTSGTPQQRSAQAKKGKQWGYHLRKETAKMPMVYGLCRWLIPQHNLIPKQLQQKQNPHTKERKSTESGPLLSTCLYKADITAEIMLPLSHKAQLAICLEPLDGKLKVKKTENRAVGVQMRVFAHQIC